MLHDDAWLLQLIVSWRQAKDPLELQPKSQKTTSTWGHAGIIPQTVLTVGVLTVLLEAPMAAVTMRWRRRGADFIVIIDTWWHLPSKTLKKINILKELLQTAAEGYRFVPKVRP